MNNAEQIESQKDYMALPLGIVETRWDLSFLVYSAKFRCGGYKLSNSYE